jgi:hypothetical protein
VSYFGYFNKFKELKLSLQSIITCLGEITLWSWQNSRVFSTNSALSQDQGGEKKKILCVWSWMGDM